MPEIAMVWKVAAGMYGLLYAGGWFWVKRVTAKVDSLQEKVSEQGETLARLESESVTEAKVVIMMSEMERRIMNNFKEVRLEIKEDLSDFRADFREDMKELRNHKE